jgi:hypothetical protein
MGKIGSYDYPEISINEAIKVAEVLVNDFLKQVKDNNEFANRLGHKSAGSGTFLVKMGNIRKYGLMENREYKATKRAEILANPKSPEEKSQAIKDMIFSIPLFNKLNSRLKTKSPSHEQFRTQLMEVTGDREKGSKDAEKIRKIYIDAISHIKNNQGSFMNNEDTDGEPPKKRKVGTNMISLQSGEVDISLPKSASNIDVIITILQNLKNEKTKE